MRLVFPVCKVRFGLQEKPMFSYDPVLCTVVKTPRQSIGDVLRILQVIEATCIDGDGLKWFNWLYLKVTQGVSAAREAAWNNAEALWHLRKVPLLDSRFMDTLDGLTTVTNRALLIPVP